MKKIIFLFLIILLLGGAFIWQGIYLPKNLFSEEEIIFGIKKGEGSKEIAYNLEKEGLIRWAPIFRIYVFTKGVSGKLQAGTYRLSSSMDIPEIAKKIAKGETAKIKVTIPESFTAEQIYQRTINIVNVDLTRLKSFEGYLFPDTYEIAYDTQGEEIIKMMLDNFNKKVTPELKTEIERQGKTLEEIIIMASLIEKEVITYEDKQIVSGIFWKRINIGMPLDSCATIAYVLGVDKWRYSFEDTRIPSPYNTYLNKGLPPGPICNPGLKSILAAIYPKNSEYWYYLSTPKGETIFSKTLEEHNIAKAEYLK